MLHSAPQIPKPASSQFHLIGSMLHATPCHGLSFVPRLSVLIAWVEKIEAEFPSSQVQGCLSVGSEQAEILLFEALSQRSVSRPLPTPLPHINPRNAAQAWQSPLPIK